MNYQETAFKAFIKQIIFKEVTITKGVIAPAAVIKAVATPESDVFFKNFYYYDQYLFFHFITDHNDDFSEYDVMKFMGKLNAIKSTEPEKFEIEFILPINENNDPQNIVLFAGNEIRLAIQLTEEQADMFNEINEEVNYAAQKIVDSIEERAAQG